MAKNKGGRPTKYSIELVTEICGRIAEGESVRKICKDEDMPHRDTINEWLKDGRYKAFTDQYVRAKTDYADSMFEEILGIADDGTNDFMERTREGGGVHIVCDHEHIQRSKQRIEARKWVLGKLMPKKYGDKITQDVTVNAGTAIDAASDVTKAALEAIEAIKNKK